MAIAAAAANATPPNPALTITAAPGVLVALVAAAVALVLVAALFVALELAALSSPLAPNAVPLGWPPNVAVPTSLEAFLQLDTLSVKLATNTISAHWYSPPSGSPFVCTWIVALVPAVMFREEGIDRSVMQNDPKPVSENVGRMMVLNADPGSLPIARRTSMLEVMWPISRETEPPVRGHDARLEQNR